MRYLITNLLLLFCLAIYAQKNCDYPDNYIPKSIKEALIYLDCTWSYDDKSIFKEFNENDAVGKLHFGTGLAIRNDWGFWQKKKNQLVKELISIGITHPDDMSSTLLTLFHRKLNNQGFNLKDEIEEYKKHYKNTKKREQIFDNEIKSKFKLLSVGDTIKVPLSVLRSSNNISFAVYAQKSNYNNQKFDCIITGVIEKKVKKEDFSLKIKIIDVWFADEQNYKRNKDKRIGNSFTHSMRYFVTIIER